MPAAANLPVHDYWSLLLSILRYLDTDARSIPAMLPYLHALPERIAHWQSRLPVLRSLWTVPGTSFVSLQKEPERVSASPAEQPMLSLGPELRDFADTAALIAGLDLVISVNTSVAHLAGALGKSYWVLLPAMGTDWRWLRQRDDSPWYPRVMRLFRQTNSHNWTSTVATLAAAFARAGSSFVVCCGGTSTWRVEASVKKRPAKLRAVKFNHPPLFWRGLARSSDQLLRLIGPH